MINPEKLLFIKLKEIVDSGILRASPAMPPISDPLKIFLKIAIKRNKKLIYRKLLTT